MAARLYEKEELLREINSAGNESNEKKIVCPEMCCYCFDVLLGYLNVGHQAHKNGYTVPFSHTDE